MVHDLQPKHDVRILQFSRFRFGNNPVIDWIKEAVVARLWRLRIHFLIIKLSIVKGFTYAIFEILH